MSKSVGFNDHPTDPSHVAVVSEHQHHDDALSGDEKGGTVQDIEDMKRMGKKQLFRVNPSMYFC